MTQQQKAEKFRALHNQSKPLVLYNIWDAGSARAVADAGAKAIATGSWSLAAAQGYRDGQSIPLDLALTVVAMITASTDLPVTVDFEGGYASEANDIVRNVARLINTGAVGLNFEDQIIGGAGIYAIDEQAQRIAAVHQATLAADVPALVNARTDLFLRESDSSKHAGLVDEAIDRATAYRDAGADCFFVPGLTDILLIEQVCAADILPVNVMIADTNANLASIAETGVARISFGPAPYFAAMSQITRTARTHL